MKKKKIYIIAVFIYILTIGTSTIAFAATDDPLQVINNLSDHIFNILKHLNTYFNLLIKPFKKLAYTITRGDVYVHRISLYDA